MTSLSEEQILAREAELRRIRDAADLELKELEVVKRYMTRLAQRQPSGVPESAPSSQVEAEPVQPRLPVDGFGGTKSARTVSGAIRLALADSERPWMTAKEIQAKATEVMGRQVPMSSISPKLTDLKNKGEIVRRDMLVALASRGEGAM